MTWAEVAALAIVMIGVVCLAWLVRTANVSTAISYRYEPTPRYARRRNRLAEKVLDHVHRMERLRHKGHWSVTVTRTQHIKPDPTPLVTPPPVEPESDNLPN